MKKEGNYTESIHNEEYYAPYNLRDIGHAGMIFMEGRETEKLNGRWHYARDLYDVGFRDSWGEGKPKRADGLSEPWDYHPEDGPETIVPGCWNLIERELFHFEGSFWYSRTFRYVPKIPGERLFLRIGAANYDTKIFLNRKFLGNHVGGSTPFFVELTNDVETENTLIVSVNNVRINEGVPMKNTDWTNWGGLYRDVELIRLPPCFIKEFFMYLVPFTGFGKIALECSLSGPMEGQGRLIIEELAIDRPIFFIQGKASLQLEAKPELWSPENPRLYRVDVTFGDDRVSDLIGFREIRTEGTDVFLNGKKIFLKGICVHEDDVQTGKFLDDADLVSRFDHARELNANFLRLAHYPHDERVAKMADRLGFLLWEEIPVYWAIQFDNPKTYADAENQLIELIKRDRNRASVIIWSVGNENQDTDDRLEFMKNLALKAKVIDPSRLRSAACLINHMELRIEDRLAEYLDIIGINEYYGWYAPDFQDLVRIVNNSKPTKPVLISEFGACAKAGHHGSRDEIFTEEYMDEVYRKQIEVIGVLDYICGLTPWILYDFNCPRRQNRFQQGFNRKGLIAEDKHTKKMAFFRLKEFYGSR